MDGVHPGNLSRVHILGRQGAADDDGPLGIDQVSKGHVRRRRAHAGRMDTAAYAQAVERSPGRSRDYWMIGILVLLAVALVVFVVVAIIAGPTTESTNSSFWTWYNLQTVLRNLTF